MQIIYKIKSAFLLVTHLVIFTGFLDADSTDIKVTFISNCGFMLTSGGKTVIFNALHKPGYYLSYYYS